MKPSLEQRFYGFIAALVVGGVAKTLFFLDPKTGTLRRRLGSFTTPVNALAFNPAGTQLAVGCGESMRPYEKQMDGSENSLRIFDLKSRAGRRRNFVAMVEGLDVSPTGEQVALAADGNAVILVEAKSLRQRRLHGSQLAKANLGGFAPRAAHSAVVRGLAYVGARHLASVSGDGKMRSHNELRVWDHVSGKEVHRVLQLEHSLRGVVSQGGWVLTRSRLEAHLWNFSSLEAKPR